MTRQVHIALGVFASFVLHAADTPKASPSVFSLRPAKARVVVVEEAGAMRAYNPQLETVRRMVDRGLSELTHQTTAKAAWRSLVSTQDVVGVKVHAAPGAMGGTRPAVAEAVVQSLLEAEFRPSRIVVWDKQLSSLTLAGFSALSDRYGVRVAGCVETGYDTNHFYDSAFLGTPVWGDYEFGQKGAGIGRKSYVSKLVSQQMTKIVNLTPLLNHNLIGVSGNLYGLAIGSVDNTIRFANAAAQLAVAVPEIYALPVLGDRVVLNIVDALSAQYAGEELSLLHYSTTLNQLRFSTDPVALDVLSIKELDRQRELNSTTSVTNDLLLYQNASLLELGVSDLRSIQVEILK